MCARENKKPKYEIAGDLERFDEADNAQARGELTQTDGGLGHNPPSVLDKNYIFTIF